VIPKRPLAAFVFDPNLPACFFMGKGVHFYLPVSLWGDEKQGSFAADFSWKQE